MAKKKYEPTIETIRPDGDSTERYLIKAGHIEIVLNAKNPKGNIELYKNGNLVYFEDVELGSDRKVHVKDINGNTVTLTDFTDDGVYEKLTYQAHDKNGDWLATAIDENFNGEIDFIHSSKVPKVMARYNGVLYEVIESGRDKYGYVINQINIDGKLKRIHFENHPYRVEDE